MKKKLILKIIIFIILFVAVWLIADGIISYKWDRSEALSSRYRAIKDIDTDIDVIFMGSSPTYAGIAPDVIWQEKGITGYNLGVSHQVAPLEYYMLKYVLQIKTPKVVVIEFNRVCEELDLEENYATNEKLFRKVVNTMPDLIIRKELIDEICNRYPSQDRWTYWFPLIRYHSRWSSIDDKDVKLFLGEDIGVFHPENLGALCSTTIKALKWPKSYPKRGSTEPLDYYWDYYQKMVDLCRENGIEVMIHIPPSLSTRKGDYEAALLFAENNNIPLLTVVKQEEWEVAGIDIKNDLYNAGHLNIWGQYKYSIIMAEFLSENFELQDHRGDIDYSFWEDCCKLYMDFYNSSTEE